MCDTSITRTRYYNKVFAYDLMPGVLELIRERQNMKLQNLRSGFVYVCENPIKIRISPEIVACPE